MSFRAGQQVRCTKIGRWRPVGETEVEDGPKLGSIYGIERVVTGPTRDDGRNDFLLLRRVEMADCKNQRPVFAASDFEAVAESAT